MLHKTIQTPEQQKWLTKLLGFDNEIHYKHESTNKVVDALSQKFEEPYSVLFAISSPILKFVEHLHGFYANHLEGRNLISKWHIDSDMLYEFWLQDGLLYMRGHLFILKLATWS